MKNEEQILRTKVRDGLILADLLMQHAVFGKVACEVVQDED